MSEQAAPPLQVVPFDKYLASPSVHWSTLSKMAISPLHYFAATREPMKPTPTMRLNQAVHCAVLEPDEFKERYIVLPNVKDDPSWQFNRKEGIARRNAYLAEHPEDKGLEPDDLKPLMIAAIHPDKGMLTDKDYKACIAQRDAVRAGRTLASLAAQELLRDGVSERTVVWRDEATGLECKGRLDWMPDERPVIVDLKGTRSVDMREFAASVARYAYHGQLAFYGDGLAWHGIATENPIIIAVESTPPYDVGVFRLPTEALVAGALMARKCLDRVAECRASGRWPGRYGGEVPLDFPRWALGESDGAPYLPLDMLDGALD